MGRNKIATRILIVEREMN